MTTAAEANPVPAPSWHGYEPDAAQRYIAFVTSGRNERQREMLTDAEEKLQSALARRQTYTEAMNETRLTLGRHKEQKQELEAAIQAPPTREELERQIELIKALPTVIGLRVEPYGGLAVHVRTLVNYGGKRIDLGDFEIQFPEQVTSEWPVVLTRSGHRADGHNIECRKAFDYQGNEFGVHYGVHSLNRTAKDAIVQLLQQGLVYEVFVLLISRLCSIDEGNVGCFNELPADPAEDPEPTWSGYMDDLVTPLAKTIEKLKDGPVRERLRQLESSITEYEDRQRRYAEELRVINAEIRGAEAELRELRARPNETIDEAAVLREYHYIRRLPGVMGMRFNRRGVPVIHVRTSHVLGNRRYDMGDFEVTFTTEGSQDRRGVLYVVQTRRVRQGMKHFYFHADGRRNFDDGWEGWFCFGARADEIRTRFRRGEFGQMMHLLVNTLNGVNEDLRSHRYLADYYREIPLDAIWRPGRLRPRRRPRDRQAGPTRALTQEQMDAVGRVALLGTLGMERREN